MERRSELGQRVKLAGGSELRPSPDRQHRGRNSRIRAIVKVALDAANLMAWEW